MMIMMHVVVSLASVPSGTLRDDDDDDDACERFTRFCTTPPMAWGALACLGQRCNVGV